MNNQNNKKNLFLYVLFLVIIFMLYMLFIKRDNGKINEQDTLKKTQEKVYVQDQIIKKNSSGDLKTFQKRINLEDKKNIDAQFKNIFK